MTEDEKKDDTTDASGDYLDEYPGLPREEAPPSQQYGYTPPTAEGQHCRDCKNMGEPEDCDHCHGGYGWPCSEYLGQHVHSNMMACKRFQPKEE